MKALSFKFGVCAEMSVSELLAEARAVQAKLVKALQDEFYCDDLEPPPSAFGWPEEALREYFESGGESGDPAATASASAAAAAAPEPPPAAPTPIVLAPSECSAGRPIILCLGDATTEFGTHLINASTAELGSAKNKASLGVTIDPVASEFLRETGTDNPRVEHGPGWTAILARDFAWRTTADLVNRGYSGYNRRAPPSSLRELDSPSHTPCPSVQLAAAARPARDPRLAATRGRGGSDADDRR